MKNLLIPMTFLVITATFISRNLNAQPKSEFLVTVEGPSCSICKDTLPPEIDLLPVFTPPTDNPTFWLWQKVNTSIDVETKVDSSLTDKDWVRQSVSFDGIKLQVKINETGQLRQVESWKYDGSNRKPDVYGNPTRVVNINGLPLSLEKINGFKPISLFLLSDTKNIALRMVGYIPDTTPNKKTGKVLLTI